MSEALTVAPAPAAGVVAALRIPANASNAARALRFSVARGTIEQAVADKALAESLTPKHWEVLVLIAAGWHAKEIARLLQRSHKTIEAHISVIGGRLGLCGRFELARFVYRVGRAKP